MGFDKGNLKGVWTADRIYGIGMGKTGTTTLVEALEILGFTPGYHGPNLRRIIKSRCAADNVVAANYRLLASRFPNAKFILTLRKKDAWLASREKHKKRYPLSPGYSAARISLYGKNDPQEADEWPAYERHTEAVRRFFKGENRLLEMDICGGDGWETLCPWLGVPVPDVTFPWRHQAPDQKLPLEK